MGNNQVIEQRLENMKNFYIKAGEIIDSLPDSIPQKYRDILKNAILGDKDLKDLMEGIESHRPPRIFLIGRTGVGKSSLINALCGAYVAKVSDTRSCTAGAAPYKCMDDDRVLMEILDTRGIAESESLDAEKTAEEILLDQVKEFSPDVAIMMLNCTHRDDIDDDVEFMKKVEAGYKEAFDQEFPIIVVINKCDEVAPSRIKEPDQYPQRKLDKIDEIRNYYREIITKNGLKVERVISVSSLIDWQTPDGMEIAVEDIDNLPKYDLEHLEMFFDGRYNIEVLRDVLEEAIQDFEAQMGLRMAARLNDVVKKVANHLTKIFAGISATISLSPIPISDIYVLFVAQCLLIVLIASLSGREVSIDTAKEFLFALGGVAGTGIGLRLLAQQGTKLINLVWPGAGSAVSSTIAFMGTDAVGKAAISYYIDGNDIDTAREALQSLRRRIKKKDSEETTDEEFVVEAE